MRCNSGDVASESVPAERSWARGRARWQGEGEPSATDVAGISTASKVKRSERTLADTRLEMEVIRQCGSGELDDYTPSRINMEKMKLEGQLDVVEYSRITVPESVHMGDPADGYLEMVKTRKSARGHLMAWQPESIHSS